MPDRTRGCAPGTVGESPSSGSRHDPPERDPLAREQAEADGEGDGGISLRLYVANNTTPSALARRQLVTLRAQLGGENWAIEVIDVFEQPALAERDRVLATPVLIRLLPLPRLSVIGDFSDSRAVAAALDLQEPNR